LPRSERDEKRTAAAAGAVAAFAMQSSSEMGGRQAEEQPGSKSSPASSGDNNNCDCVDISPQPATAPPAQPEAGHEEVTEEVRAAGEPLTLQQRAAIMFSGQNGAPVASGDTRALATEPTLGLVRDIGVLVDNLPGELFDAHAPRRPCGVLDRYEASGMLLGDALGYPLLPRGKDSVSQKLGKAMKKLPGEIAPKQAAARKAAKRRGTDLEKAAGAVLDEPVKLTALPPKEDIPSQQIARTVTRATGARTRTKGSHARTRTPAAAASPPPEAAAAHTQGATSARTHLCRVGQQRVRVRRFG